MDSLDAESFYDLSLVTELAVAPDGDRIAFVGDEFDPEEDERVRSLFVVSTDGDDDPYRLTRASGAAAPTWSPDGRHLGFVAARDADPARSVGAADDDEDEEEGDEGTGGGGARARRCGRSTPSVAATHAS